MKFNLLSDIHLEFASLVLPGGDNLLLAGDIIVADFLRIGRVPNKDKFRIRFEKFFKEECAKYKQVFYIAGNHCHYNGIYEQTHDLLREAVKDTNVKFLENDVVDLDEVVLFGATLWTDVHNRDPYVLQYLERHMNDFYCIHHDKKLERKGYALSNLFLPIDTTYIHEETLRLLKVAVDQYRDRKMLVMTHHTPSNKSVAAKYNNDYAMNCGYHTELSEFILDHPNIVVWVHGHTHTSFDYMIGGCRVICNPRGYSAENSPTQENMDFDIGFTFDV